MKTTSLELPLPQKTPDHEVAALLELIRRTKGHILEVGSFLGQTARTFANTFPERLVFAVDWSWADMAPGQSEALPVSLLGHLCKGLPNVFFYNENSHTFRFPCKDITFAFIDGDHTLEGVAADTDMVLSQMQPGGIVAWHDFYDRDWSQVETYLRNQEKEGRFELNHIKDTCIVYVTEWTK